MQRRIVQCATVTDTANPLAVFLLRYASLAVWENRTQFVMQDSKSTLRFAI